MAIQLRLADTAPGTLQPAQNLTNAVLLQTEQMNNAVLTELNATVRIFQSTLEKSQAALKEALDKNQLLEQEIIQLNTFIKENEKSHAAEIAKNTQSMTQLADTVNALKGEQQEQKTQLEGLIQWCNQHNHKLGFDSGPLVNHVTNWATSAYVAPK